jgi:rhodanese-related sulfurtransferase
MANKLLGFIPVPPDIQPQSRVQDLKARLDWGEPALTIIDARDHNAFNQGHISGAVSMPVMKLVDQAKANLEPERDIYIYCEVDEETEGAAALLREAGFQNVSELRGGLSAWKAMGYPVDGPASLMQA